jgi:hypothetical protein
MKKSLFLLLSIAVVSSAQAQFFGGYADGVTSLPTGDNVIGTPLRIIYDDFTFDIAGDIMGFDLVGLDNTGSPVAMYYEIRTGMSDGNPGTLLYSGTTASAFESPLPTNGSFGTPPSGSGTYARYEGGFPGGSELHLAAGTYWIGLAPLESFGYFAVASTQGFGSIGHPIGNGNAFYYDSSNPSLNYVSMGATDFAVQVDTLANTNVAVPEPSITALIAVAAVAGFLGRRARR